MFWSSLNLFFVFYNKVRVSAVEVAWPTTFNARQTDRMDKRVTDGKPPVTASKPGIPSRDVDTYTHSQSFVELLAN
jgi:hypothetical protein